MSPCLSIQPLPAFSEHDPANGDVRCVGRPFSAKSSVRHIPLLKDFVPPVLWRLLRTCRQTAALRLYRSGRRVPWSAGFHVYQRRFIRDAIKDGELMRRMRSRECLPEGYGVGLSERCVEYPWLLANLDAEAGLLLDAGSTLNNEYVLAHERLRAKTIHILTLGPEESCFWTRGISYLYGDLRDIPIRDDFYDSVVCISTLEHVGFDNSEFAHSTRYRESKPEDFLLAIREMRRVLRFGGAFYLTVPFGGYQKFKTAQQFDDALLSRAITTFGPTQSEEVVFFKYARRGWNFASADDCAPCQYVDWISKVPEERPAVFPVQADNAAAARAVACVKLLKG